MVEATPLRGRNSKRKPRKPSANTTRCSIRKSCPGHTSPESTTSADPYRSCTTSRGRRQCGSPACTRESFSVAKNKSGERRRFSLAHTTTDVKSSRGKDRQSLAEELGSLSFLSWVRQGLGSAIALPDTSKAGYTQAS